MSNPIFRFPNKIPVLSDNALTKASPEFIITFAMTEREIPKPKIIIPPITHKKPDGIAIHRYKRNQQYTKVDKNPEKQGKGYLQKQEKLKVLSKNNNLPHNKQAIPDYQTYAYGQKSNFKLMTLATEETEETPKSPLLVTATPMAAKNRLKTKRIYLLKISLVDTIFRILSAHAFFK